MPSVSVAIPTFSRKEDLFVAVKSALNQTKVPDEIVISFDGPLPTAQRHIASFLEELKFQSYRIIVNPGPFGQIENVNYLIKNLSTDLFILLHDDDFLYPNAVEELTKAFQLHPDTVVSIGKTKHLIDNKQCSEEFDEQENRVHSRNFNQYRIFGLVDSFLRFRLLRSGFMVVTKKAQLVNFSNETPYGRERAADIVFFSMLCERFPSSKVTFTPEHVSAYNFHKNSVSRSGKTTYFFFIVHDLKVSFRYFFLKFNLLRLSFPRTFGGIKRDLDLKNFKNLYISFWILKRNKTLISKIYLVLVWNFFSCLEISRKFYLFFKPFLTKKTKVFCKLSKS